MTFEAKIAEIKNRADIVDIVSEVVILKKAGKNYTGLCPFHTEKTPSFTVNRDKQFFHCFGCGVGGDVFVFVQRHQGVGFMEAARWLAQRCGITPPGAGSGSGERSDRERLVAVNQYSMRLYRDVLADRPEGRTGRDYLSRRGLAPQIVQAFKLGFAPPGGQFLVRCLGRKPSALPLAEKAGLLVRRDSGGYYDRFRDRVLFPILDRSGRVLAFGGRVLGSGHPKYLNSPETPVFNKRRALYGVHAASAACRTRNRVFVVEGYFDVLAMHHFGLTNCVATLGTALSTDHVQQLRRLVGSTGQIVLVFDADDAGINAARRSAELFTQGFAEARILVLPRGHDPDTYLRADGPEAFDRLAQRAADVFSFILDRAVERHGLSVEGRVRVVTELTPFLAGVDDPARRTLHIADMAERIGVAESAIAERVRHHRRAGRRPGTEAASPPTGTRVWAGERLERKLVAMLLQFPDSRILVRQAAILPSFAHPGLRAAGIALADGDTPPGAGALEAALKAAGQNDALRRTLRELALAEETWDLDGCRDLIDQYRAFGPGRVPATLARDIRAAEESNEPGRLRALLEEKQRQARQRAALLHGNPRERATDPRAER